MSDKRYIEESNLRLLQRLHKGDIVKIPSETHVHCGIYVGDYNIVHIFAANTKSCGGDVFTVKVIEESFMTVAKDSIAFVEYEGYSSYRPLINTRVVANARRSLGEKGYAVMFESCQKFVDWCRHGNGRARREDLWEINTPGARNIPVIQCNTFNLLRKIEKGDILKRHKDCFCHCGMYVGNNKVIRISLHPVPEVKEESILTFINGDVAERDNHSDDSYRTFDSNTISERAKSKIGRYPYHWLYKNEEHFVNWCRYGFQRSNKTLMYQIGVTVAVCILLCVTIHPAVGILSIFITVPLLYLHEKRNTPSDTLF